MKKKEDKRRWYKFGYGDVAELGGMSVSACRKYFSRRSMLLSVGDAVGNLGKVVEYVRDCER